MRRNIRAVVSAIAIAMLMAACDKNAHEGEWGVSVCLTYEDADDAVTAVDDVRLWIYASGGALIDEYHFDDAKSLASTLLQLPAGEYVFVAAVNLLPPYSYVEQSEDVADYENLLFCLDEPDASPEHVFYGTTAVEWDGMGIRQAIVTLHRVMAELAVVVEGVPDGCRMDMYVGNAADGVFPARISDGHYGTASSGARNNVAFPEAAEDDGRIATEIVRLMPTMADDSRSMLHMEFVLADGSLMECDAEAPPMKPSGKYELCLKYDGLSPYMNISTIVINDWGSGTILPGGEALD